MSANPIEPIGPGWPVAAIDLHQHLWPEPFVDRLRARSRTPYLRGWTLYTARRGAVRDRRRRTTT